MSYQCEICKLNYADQKLAETCSKSLLIEQPCKPGDEIKLLNKSRSWTLAKCKEIKISPTRFSEFMTEGAREDYDEPHIDFNVNRHEWLITVEKEVFLDKKWQEFRKQVPSSFLVKEDQLKWLSRIDNAG